MENIDLYLKDVKDVIIHYPFLPQIALSDRKARRKLSTVIEGIPWQKTINIVGTIDHVVVVQIGAIFAE